MDDLLSRLKRAAALSDDCRGGLMSEAAGEIERLRAERDRLFHDTFNESPYVPDVALANLVATMHDAGIPMDTKAVFALAEHDKAQAKEPQ